MKQRCANCHFFYEESRIVSSGQVFKLPINNKKREKVKKNDLSWMRDSSNYECFHGVWSTGIKFENFKLIEVIAMVNRKDYCFFFPHKEGMFFTAAKVLQKRKWELKETSKDRKHTICGLYIAGGALFVNVVI